MNAAVAIASVKQSMRRTQSVGASAPASLEKRREEDVAARTGGQVAVGNDEARIAALEHQVDDLKRMVSMLQGMVMGLAHNMGDSDSPEYAHEHIIAGEVETVVEAVEPEPESEVDDTRETEQDSPMSLPKFLGRFFFGH